MVIRMTLEQLLKQCKFSKRYHGYGEFMECLRITLANEDSLTYITGVYMEAAAKCHISWSGLERNIRTMLDHSWQTGGRIELEKISGCTLYAKPTIGELLEDLTCYLKEHPEIKCSFD